MNIEHLKIFTDLAENLSYTQTAINVHLTQPAVSQAIKSLEKEIGIQLLERDQHNVSLTVAGKIFLKEVEPLLEQFDLSIENSKMVAERTKSAITIGYTGTVFETEVLPLVIKQSNNKHPHLNIYLENFRQNFLKKYLLEGQCDLIFQTADALQNSQQIEFQALEKGNFVCVVPEAHVLAKKFSLTIEDLKSETIILLNDQQCPPEQKKIQHLIRKTCNQATFCYSDSVLLSYTMVRKGLGVSILPNFVIGNSQEAVITVPLEYEAELIYGIARLKKQKNEIVDDFVSQLLYFSNKSKGDNNYFHS